MLSMSILQFRFGFPSHSNQRWKEWFLFELQFLPLGQPRTKSKSRFTFFLSWYNNKNYSLISSKNNWHGKRRTSSKRIYKTYRKASKRGKRTSKREKANESFKKVCFLRGKLTSRPASMIARTTAPQPPAQRPPRKYFHLLSWILFVELWMISN